MAVSVERVTFSNGRSMPVIGLGTHALAEGEQVISAVKAAVRAGYRHIDCAAIYRNETSVGVALKELFDAGEVKREELFITSKLWNTFHRPDMVTGALQTCLQQLGLEYIDLYLMHWPLAYKDGHDLKPKDENGKMIYSDHDYVETWQAMEKCVAAGKTRDIGLSNFNSAQINRLMQHATIMPVALQVEVNCHNTNVKLIQFAQARSLAVIGYAPLSTPSKQREHTQLLEEPVVKTIAEKYDKTPAQVAIRFLVEQDLATVPKSCKPERILENCQVFDFKLSDEEIGMLAELNRNFRVYGEEIAL